MLYGFDNGEHIPIRMLYTGFLYYRCICLFLYVEKSRLVAEYIYDKNY